MHAHVYVMVCNPVYKSECTDVSNCCTTLVKHTNSQRKSTRTLEVENTCKCRDTLSIVKRC